MYMFLFCETSNNIIVLYIYMTLYNFYFETSKGKAQKEKLEVAEKGESCGNIPYVE